MGRPIEFDKDEVLEKAMHVFWQKSFESASLQDLIEAMDLSKSSFYQSFTSKQDLYLKCLDNYQNKQIANLIENLAKAKSSKEFIEGMFAEVIATANIESGKFGCFLLNATNEFPFGDVNLSPFINKSFQKMEVVWQIAIKQAQEEGDIPAEKDASALASYLLSSMTGLRTMIKAGTSPQSLRKIVETILPAFFSK